MVVRAIQKTTEPNGMFSENWVLCFHFLGKMSVHHFESRTGQLHQELWGHIFVESYWDPNYMFGPQTTSHKMTAMTMATKEINDSTW